MTQLRSLLFVPGIRPERFDKAISAGADAVCIDLEDAVPPADKESGRAATLDFVRQRSTTPACAVGIRINGLTTEDGQKDVAALITGNVRPDFIMIPKAEVPADIVAMIAKLGSDHPPIWAVIETVAGLMRIPELASLCAPTGGILFGGADFSAEIGTSMDWEPLLYARGKLAVEARTAQVTLMDVPYLDVRDPDGLKRSTRLLPASARRGPSLTAQGGESAAALRQGQLVCCVFGGGIHRSNSKG